MAKNARSYYRQIIPAQGWAFIQQPIDDNEEIIALPVAAWAFTRDRDVLGLIAVPDENTSVKISGIVCCTLEPPKLPGAYKPVSELTDAELRSLEMRSVRAVGTPESPASHLNS